MALAVSCRESTPAPQVQARPAPPSAPSTMAASVVIPRPQQSYEAAREAGADGRTLPWQLPVLLAHQLGMPPLTSGRFLPQHPVVGALSITEGEASWALAFRVVSGAEIVAELSTGADARFSARVQDGVTILRGARSSLGVVDSTLLVGSSEAMLVEYAPYIARTLMVEAQAAPTAVERDAVVKLTKRSGSLFDGMLEASTRELGERLQAALAAEIQSRGAAPTLIDVQQLFALGSDLLDVLRTGVQSVSGGELLLTIDSGKLRLDGTIQAVTGAQAMSDGSCPSWLSVPQDVLVGMVLPERSLREENLLRLWAAMGGEPAAAPVGKGGDSDGAQSKKSLQEFARSLESPLLLALGSFEGNSMGFASARRREGDDVDPVSGPASLLRTKAMSQFLQGVTLVAPKAPFPAEGATMAKGANGSEREGNLEFAWKRRGSVTTWGLGSGSRAWLSEPLMDAPRLFPSWQNLCGHSPLFAIGFAHRSLGVTDAAVVAAQDSVLVSMRLPLAVLFSWVQTGGPPP